MIPPTNLMEAINAFQSGDLDRARKFAEREVASAPSPLSQHLLGLIHCRLGNSAKGVEHLKAAADAELGNLEFQVSLARALIDSGRAADVLAMREPPPVKSGAELALWHARAEAAALVGAVAAAAEAWRVIANASPKDWRAWVSLARSLLRLEKFAEAEAAYQSALSISPFQTDALHELGMLYERTSEIDRLLNLLNQALAGGVGKDQLPFLWALYQFRRGTTDEVRELLSTPGADHDPIRWNRLRAKVEDRAGNADIAFAAATAMNRATPHFDAWRRRSAQYRDQLRELAETITEDWAAQLNSVGRAAECRPVFLVGFPRSGTTLLDTFLMGHSEILVIEELPLLFDAGEAIGPLREMVSCRTLHVEQARDRYLAALAKHVGGKYPPVTIDKFPLNMVAVPLIHCLFPGAAIVFAQRHPCGAVLSGFMQAFDPNLGMASFLEIGDAADFYDAAMSVWTASRKVLPVNVQTVVYEELVADPEATLRPVIEFLGLQWDERLLDHRTTAITRGPIGNTSYDQVTEPLSSDAIFRWQRYRKQMQPVLPVLLPWAERLGYGD